MKYKQQKSTSLMLWSAITLFSTIVILSIFFHNISKITNQFLMKNIIEWEAYAEYERMIQLMAAKSIFVLFLIIVFFITYVILCDRKKMQELSQTILTDALTQMHTQISFCHEMPILFKKNKQKKYAIVIVDIHEFKLINYNYSYCRGDQLLCCIAESLAAICGEEGLIARIGSDCFALLMQQEEMEKQNVVDAVTGDIRKKLGNEIASSVRLMMGYYLVTDMEEDSRSIMDKAVIAWKYAKKNELKCKAYDETLLKNQIKAKQIQDRQNYALINEELEVYMQPKIDLKTNGICGAEALIRWNSKEMGFMAPDEFIPILETNGFIKQVDFFVLEKVCQCISDKKHQCQQMITVSINQSRATILDVHYLQRIKDIISKYQIQTEFLDLEVTESLFIGDFKVITDKLTQIHKMGISISMDDFGSGFSSLNLLKKMSIDNLKIDKEFLDESETSEQTRIIIKSVIDMARQLNMRVICEGVETKEQVEFLKDIYCDEAQGYYFGRPIPMLEFCQKLRDGHLGNIPLVK